MLICLRKETHIDDKGSLFLYKTSYLEADSGALVLLQYIICRLK